MCVKESMHMCYSVNNHTCICHATNIMKKHDPEKFSCGEREFRNFFLPSQVSFSFAGSACALIIFGYEKINCRHTCLPKQKTKTRPFC